MKLKTRERYTLRMMMTIAELSKGLKPVGLSRVSSHSGISRRYLEQLVIPLKHADLVHGVAGREGGYLLSRKPSDIRLDEIISAATGEIAVTACTGDGDNCAKSGRCNCKELWNLINYRIRETLRGHSLADLISEEWPSIVEGQIAAAG